MVHEPGSHLKFDEYVNFYGKDLNLSDLVKLSPEKLALLERDSIAEEENICGKIKDMVNEWKSQAKTTIRLRKAQQYQKLPETEHTSNKWVKDKYDWHEISNMVYKMTYRIYERTKWNDAAKDCLPVAWELTWYLVFNTPKDPDDSSSGRQIAGQRDKRFLNKFDMEKYLQGRIQAYSHLFVEISPHVPKEAARRFSVHGLLLPGYTVETPEMVAPSEESIEDLLDFLDEGDFSGSSQGHQSIPPKAEQTPEEIWSRNRKHRQGAGQRVQAPTR